MPDQNQSPIDSLAHSFFGDAISHYARDNESMERHAISVVYTSIAALQFPEEYAFLVLATRMDFELQKIILNVLHKQGNPNRLFGRVLSNFATKIDIAYGCGFITDQMYRAIELVRKIRNLYGHSEDPHAVRSTSEYTNFRKQLIILDRITTNLGAQNLHELHSQSNSTKNLSVDQFELIGILVTICDNLSLAAFYSQNRPSMPQNAVIPAFYAMSEVPEMVTVGGQKGFFPKTYNSR